MQALVLTQPEHLEWREVAVPVCGEMEALIRVESVSVCGSDVHSYKGKSALLTFPRVMGHEVCGIVEEVKDGEGSFAFAPGDKVVLVPYIGCGHCIACRKGKPNCCTDLQVYGVHIDGAMTGYITAPLKNLYKVDREMDPLTVSAVEPFAISAHAVRRSGASEGDTVLVVGGGPIGLGAAEIARTKGSQVLLAETDPTRRAFARERFGYEMVLNPLDGNFRKQLEELTGGDYPDIIIDSTGVASAMAKSVTYLSNGGRLVYVGICQGDLQISDVEFHKRETELMGSRGATMEDFAYVIHCIAQGKIDPGKFITHTAPFSKAKEAFAEWVSMGGAVFKSAFTMKE